MITSVFSAFRTSSPPPLDWPLPSQYDQCELKVEVQPKSYHRAHYETEGSRGSIKAAAGHPIVKVRPHYHFHINLFCHSLFNLSLFSIYFKVSYLGTDLIWEIQGYYRNKLK